MFRMILQLNSRNRQFTVYENIFCVITDSMFENCTPNFDYKTVRPTETNKKLRVWA